MRAIGRLLVVSTRYDRARQRGLRKQTASPAAVAGFWPTSVPFGDQCLHRILLRRKARRLAVVKRFSSTAAAAAGRLRRQIRWAQPSTTQAIFLVEIMRLAHSICNQQPPRLSNSVPLLKSTPARSPGNAGQCSAN